MTLRRDSGRLLERADLHGVFDAPLGGDRRQRILHDRMRRGIPTMVERPVALEHTSKRSIHELVCAERVEESLTVLQQAFELFVERRDQIRLVDTELLHRRARPQSGSVPHLSLPIARAKKKNRLVRTATHTIGRENRVGFVESGQVVKITSRAERVEDVAIAEPLGRGRENEETVAEPIEDTLPALVEQLR